MGSIECHVSDAVGEEFLEYMWEPVGSTTRDYLDNPQIDRRRTAPNPSVVAPEAPRVRDAGVVPFGGDDVSLPVSFDGDLPRDGSFVVIGGGGVCIEQSSERVLSIGGSD